MPKLIVSIDNVVVKEVQLTKDRSTIGRRPYNDVVIDNLAVSGKHATIDLADGRATLEDAGSTNGTYVNGRAIKTQTLEHNDIIQIGKYQIKYLESNGGSALAGLAATAASPAGSDNASTALMTMPASPGGPRVRVLNGAAAGREMALTKEITTIGKPGLSVAAIARKSHGFDISHTEGDPAAVNGVSTAGGPIALKSHDQIELGGTRLEFVDR
ncbi:MAG: FHA domain-containing protein [Desulfovibrionaceae bacterium]|jgi:pSer/pThr/pTyr-binding forkhead associated (FHA) protein|nr:FHA domain-containing protein [Desulfovibrionaceae bacterium]